MTRGRKRGGTTDTDKRKHPVQMLLDDHREVKLLFAQFDRTEDQRAKMSIVEAALEELTIHAAVEEEIFYPSVREKMDDKRVMNEAVEEHHVAKFLISELENMDASDDRYEAKFIVLAENVKHHIKEEESEMLPKARKLDLDWERIGREMAALKERLLYELKDQAFSAALETKGGRA